MGRGDQRRPRGREREEVETLDERVIHIARTAKVVQGGRRFKFRAVVVVGDNERSVGVGVGKAREVPDAIRKGSERARKSMMRIPLVGTTIPHQVIAKHSGATVMLKPASPGTGVIAGGVVRAVLEAAGLRDVLTKSLGSANMLNVARATMACLAMLRVPEEEARRRGVPVENVRPFWLRRAQTVPAVPAQKSRAEASLREEDTG